MSETQKAAAKQAKGSVKEAIGKLTGDSQLERAGRREKVAATSSPASAPERLQKKGPDGAKDWSKKNG